MVINLVAATIALLIVVKMLYQIEYVHHEYSNVNCTVSYHVINFFKTLKSESIRIIRDAH